MRLREDMQTLSRTNKQVLLRLNKAIGEFPADESMTKEQLVENIAVWVERVETACTRASEEGGRRFAIREEMMSRRRA